MTISEYYRDLNKQLHSEYKSFGTSGKKWASAVRVVYAKFNANSLLDYGCGKQTLAKALPELPVSGYDPAIPELSARPSSADLVVCGDVLEHIEPDHLDEVIDDLCQLSKKLTFVVLSTREAKKILPDGRNAHLIVKPAAWWIDKFESKFEILFIYENQMASELVLLMSVKESTLATLFNKLVWIFRGRDICSKMFLACLKAYD